MVRKIPAIEMCLSMISIWWAIVLFNNDEMFNMLPTRLEGLAGIQESGWAIVFTISAFVKVLGVALMNKGLRKTGLIFSAFLYGLVASGYILADNVLNTGTGVYFSLSVLALWGIREVSLDESS